MLSISNLHVSVADKAILRGLTLDLPAREAPAVMGSNGAGGGMFPAGLRRRA